MALKTRKKLSEIKQKERLKEFYDRLERANSAWDYYFNRICIGEKVDSQELISKIDACNLAEWVVLNEKYRK